MPQRFDELLTINEPHLVERYARALAAFGYKMPKLEKFGVDVAGYSPQIAKKLRKPGYMDAPDGNRRFVILSPEQASLPAHRSSFSNTGELMREFFSENRREIYALTIKDVIFGEIEDSLFEIESIEDLLKIEQVEFKIGTHENLTAKTADLKLRMDRLLTEPDAWRDNAMLEEMVALAKHTGDIRENALLPAKTVFRHEAYWCAHFGGAYVFRDDARTSVICDRSAKGFRAARPWVTNYFDREDHRNIFNYLVETGRLDPPRGSWIERSGLIDLRITMAVAALAHREGLPLPASLINKSSVRRWLREHSGLASKDPYLEALRWVERQTEDWEEIDIRRVDPELLFALSRANPDHEDRDLVNRLVAEHVPFDFITRYAFNRDAFLQDFAEMREPMQEFVVTALEDHYLDSSGKLHHSLFE